MLDSPFIEEGYRVYNITLRPIGVEQRVKLRGAAITKNIKELTLSPLSGSRVDEVRVQVARLVNVVQHLADTVHLLFVDWKQSIH